MPEPTSAGGAALLPAAAPGGGRIGRRRFLMVGTTSAVGLGAVATAHRWAPADIPLYSQTVAFTSPDHRSTVSTPGGVRTGTRVAVDARESRMLLQREESWLAGLAPWVAEPGEHSTLLRQALLDIYVLSDRLPAPVAGWTPRWRYVWPRDVAHVAVALAAVGNPDRALDALAFFRTVPRRAGLFEARYLLDGSGSPDQRTPQFDGLGWTLWALGRIHANGSTAVRQRIVDDFGDLAADLAGTICEQIDANDGLPPTSPDYWEHEESSLTLGTVAPTLAGLMSTGPLWHDLGATRLGERVAATADHLEATTVQYFGSTGYQRYASGGGPDAATAFLVGPYVDQFAHGAVVPLLSEAEERMRRPAGGLAPGARWKRDGISWTPQTSLFAMAYAHTGQDDRAHRLLRWLDRHRTAAGSLPEKVLHDGTPSAVAPLAWTAANVVLAVAALR